MATVKLIEEKQASDEVKAVFDDIRKTRGTRYINNFWRAIAHDPVLLKRTWEELKVVMGPGEIDPLTKEMVYIAVSVANACTYCTHTHTASAKAKGMTEAQHMELLSIIAVASKTNALLNAMQIPVDKGLEA